MSVAEWKSVLESLRKGNSARDARHAIQREGDISDDDYNIDLAKAALKTGIDAFDHQDWHGAESMFQEALRLLQDIPAEQRAFCNFFGLNYRLAVCTFYTQDQKDAYSYSQPRPMSSKLIFTMQHTCYQYHAFGQAIWIVHNPNVTKLCEADESCWERRAMLRSSRQRSWRTYMLRSATIIPQRQCFR